jgi:purine-binding chemotaxis protein CheW
MDFLQIRKKAKERAEARAAEAAPVPGPGAAAEAPPAPVPGAAPADARFATWRPDAGLPPPVAPDAPPPLRAACGEDLAGTGPLVPPPPEPEAPPAPAEPEPEASADPLDEFFYRAGESAPSLPQVGAAADAVPEEPAPLAREEYLTFLLGPEEYAVAIERVREVVRAPPITEVPRAPAHVLGVVTVRGEVVAVVDPRRRLGLAPAPHEEGEGKVVIVDAGDGPCGLLVDRVASVVRLRPGSIEPCPQGIAGQRAEYLAGIGRAGERLFTVLELATLLRPPGGAARGGGLAAGASPRSAARAGGAGLARSGDAA